MFYYPCRFVPEHPRAHSIQGTSIACNDYFYIGTHLEIGPEPILMAVFVYLTLQERITLAPMRLQLMHYVRYSRITFIAQYPIISLLLQSHILITQVIAQITQDELP